MKTPKQILIHQGRGYVTYRAVVIYQRSLRQKLFGLPNKVVLYYGYKIRPDDIRWINMSGQANWKTERMLNEYLRKNGSESLWPESLGPEHYLSL